MRRGLYTRPACITDPSCYATTGMNRFLARLTNVHREGLLEQLNRYGATDGAECVSRRRIVDFVKRHSDCFDRSLSVGHITGSAWLLDPTGERALLTFHRKLGMWLQLGGHADGNPNVLEVALREAREESGLEAIVPVTPEIFDVDVHPIPAYGGEPAHDHYDVRFLLQASDSDRLVVSDESIALNWVSPDELASLPVDESVRRMSRKWLARLGARI